MGTMERTHTWTTDRLCFVLGSVLGIAALVVLSFFGA